MATKAEKSDAVAKFIRDMSNSLVELENVCDPSVKNMVRVLRARNMLADILWDMVDSDS